MERAAYFETLSKQHKLSCPECGTIVFFRKGSRILPHFYHRRNSSHFCSSAQSETPEHRRAKYLLYWHFRDNYPFAKVHLEKTLPNSRRPDVLVEFDINTRLALEFQRASMGLQELIERKQEYAGQGIKDLWLLSANTYKGISATEQMSLMEMYLSIYGLNRFVPFLDVTERCLILRKAFKQGELDKSCFKKSYKLDELLIRPSGKIRSSFARDFRLARNRRAQPKAVRKSKVPSGPKRKITPRPEQEQIMRIERARNPEGLWRDQNGQRWADCEQCGQFTYDFIDFNGAMNSGICRECHYKDWTPKA